MSVEDIQKLNPAYLKGFIPSNVLGNNLTLPKRVMRAVKAYLEEKNLDTETETVELDITKFTAKIPSKEAFYEPSIYVVQQGETIDKLASVLDLSHYHIRLWNDMDFRAQLDHEAHLTLYGIGFPTMEEQAVKVVMVAKVDALPPTPISPIQQPLQNMPPNTFVREDYIYYVVNTKENLSDIAAKFNGVTVLDIMILNNFQSNQIPKAGREIRIKKL
ncbi:MAG: LysM peptidoglycan-binding domain-containing protein [Saprospiraceae bacterium]|nr:LysM peptidoglycan-binding domain-containing protein [Saprospiraceae bacterium]